MVLGVSKCRGEICSCSAQVLQSGPISIERSVSTSVISSSMGPKYKQRPIDHHGLQECYCHDVMPHSDDLSVTS